jgi:hypothetical protein
MEIDKMASLDFYALKDDMCALIHFIFRETDLRVFESYSAYDSELREFRSFEELSAAFTLGISTGGTVLLQLWSPTIIRKVEFERIALKVPGHSYRYRILGVGLIQLYFGGESNGIITESHYGHWSEAGARQRSTGDPKTVDWGALSKISGCVQRQLRKKALAKIRGRLILPVAFMALQRGVVLRYSSLEFSANSPEIQLLAKSASYSR